MKHSFTQLWITTFRLLAFLCPTILLGQASNVPLHHLDGIYVERLEVLSGIQSPVHSVFKNISREDVFKYAQLLDRNWATARSSEKREIAYLFADNEEWWSDSLRQSKQSMRKGIRGWFFNTPAAFVEVNKPAFNMRINPILHVEAGRERGDEELLFSNKRGLEIRGNVDDKLWFSTNVVEQQVRFPSYVNERIDQFQSVPGAGFYKSYKSRLFNIENGYDFNIAQAYIGFKASKHIGFQFGHDKQFIGNGYRSMFLSDFSAPFFFLKMNTRVWRLHYQNLFMELTPFSRPYLGNGDVRLPKKYAAIHVLDFNITPKLSIGFFEATVMNRSRQFEFQYMNPVILYRTVEGMIGSPDNVMVGLNGKWDLFRHVRVYGQFLLDEFVFRELYKPEKKGWWGNKYGIQAGIKYFNAFKVNNLDVQLEFNSARPYTYAHYDSLNSWSHYNQPLAHPLGGNFREFIALARFQPMHRLVLNARAIYMQTGDDSNNENWGSNVLFSYNRRENDYGNKIGQGVKAKTMLLGLDASWMLFHNCFVDLHIMRRQKNSADPLRDRNSTIFSGGIRLNFQEQRLDF